MRYLLPFGLVALAACGSSEPARDRRAPDTAATCPNNLGDATEVAIAFSANEPQSTFRCRLDDEAEGECASPFYRSGLTAGAHVFTVYATDRAGNKDDTPATCAFTVTAGVDTTVACPAELVNTGSHTFTFAASVEGVAFQCRVDDQPASACTSPHQITVGEGEHTFEVRAGGDPTPASCTWTVDTSPPVVTITAPSAGEPISTTQTYTWTVDDSSATVRCTLDGAVVPCAEGSYTATGLRAAQSVTFTVTVTDAAGNSASDSTTNVAGPAVTVVLTPSGGGEVAQAGEAQFGVVDAAFTDVAYVCQVTLGASTRTVDPCTSPLAWSGLAHGDDVQVTVTATDLVTATQGPPATRTATVDAQGPVARIASPAAPTVGPLVTFEFSEEAPLETGAVTWTCDGPGGQFECAPGVALELGALSSGEYTLTVYGVDQFGNSGQASISFTVDAQGPTVTITRQPTGEVCPASTADTRVLFSVDASGPSEPAGSVTYRCSLDGGAAVDCGVGDNAGAFSWSGLPEGEHVLAIIGYDRFGNAGPVDGLRVTFTVDADPPRIEITRAPSGCVDGSSAEVLQPNGTIAIDTSDDPESGLCPTTGLRTLRCTLEVEDGAGFVPVEGYVDLDCMDHAFEYGEEAGRAALVDGTYALTVDAEDAIGLTSSLTHTFVVDGTPPVVTLLTPSGLADIVAAEATQGTFSAAPDASTVGPDFTCAIDGVAQDCDDRTFELSGLAESSAGHLLRVSGADCVGNTSDVSLRFFVDASPPVVSSAPQVFVDDAGATAQVRFGFSDAITNVEALDCLLDHDEQGKNPHTAGEGDLLFVSCATLGATGLPTAWPSGDPPRPQLAINVLLSMSELSAGRHILWVRARDYWGHSSELTAVSFDVDATAAPSMHAGHVVAIGHDYTERSLDLDALLGNAVLLTRAREFDRPLRLLTLDLGAAEVDAAGAPVISNVLDGIKAHLEDAGECSAVCFEHQTFAGDAAALDEGLAARLHGHDVLLILDQNSPAEAARIGAKPGWHAALREYLDRGGVVIVLDGLAPDGAGAKMLSQNVAIAGNAEPWNSPEPPRGSGPMDSDVNVLDAVAIAAGSSLVSLDCRNTNPLAADVGADGVYTPPSDSVVFLPDPLAIDVFSMLVPSQQGERARPVVLDRRFPRDDDLGPVRLAAFGEGLARGSSSYAAFSAPDGSIVSVCPLRADGTASHETPRGGMVTVASVSLGCTCDGAPVPSCDTCGGSCACTTATRHLESVAGVLPGDLVRVGLSRPTPRPMGSVTVALPTFSGAARYTVSNGCSSTSDTNGGSLPFASDCVVGEAPPLVHLVATAHADDGRVIAYNVLTGVETTYDAATQAWTAGVDVADWGPWTPNPFEVQVTYVNEPAADSAVTMVALGHPLGPVYFQEDIPSQGTLPFWAPVPGDVYDADPTTPFADVFRVTSTLAWTSSTDGRAHYTQRVAHQPVPTSSQPEYTIDRAAFLPRFTVSADGGTDDRPELTWLSSGPTGALAAADGGFATWSFTPAQGECADVGGQVVSTLYGQWIVSMPAADSGALRLPSLTDASQLDLTCWVPATRPQSTFALFFESDAPGDTPASARRASMDTLFGLSSQHEPRPVGSATRMSLNIAN